MGHVGRWGVTRDGDGQLASLMEWPWYWRYAGGVALLIATAWLSYTLAEAGKSAWLWGASLAAGLLYACVVMYEIGALAILIALAAITWFATDTFFPEVRVPDWLVTGALIAAVAHVWVSEKTTRLIAEKNRRSLQRLWQHLSEESKRSGVTIFELEERIDHLERVNQRRINPNA